MLFRERNKMQLIEMYLQGVNVKTYDIRVVPELQRTKIL